MPAPPNHYQILNVAPDAEPVVIEAAYRALMKKYHPDQAVASAARGPSAAEINRAFATLRNPDRRAEYDRREWTHSQNVQMAAYRPPPAQRVSRVFGWGGWVVAMILGGVIAMMTGRANEVVLARAEEAARVATGSAEPDLRSQPSLPEEPFVSPESLAELAAPPPAIEGDPLPPAAELQDVPLDAAGQVRVQSAPSGKAAGAKPRRPARQAPRARTAAEKDFLEREGYIY
jgi:curved DNA-binding protein CbpA